MTTDPARCRDFRYQVALAVVTDIPAEVPLLNDVAACTNSDYSGLWLGNDGEVVWTTTTTFGGEQVHYSDQEGAGTFAWAAGRSEVFLLPGQVIVIDAHPDDVKWLYDGPLSAGWGRWDMLWDTVEEEAPGAAARLIKTDTARGRAAKACVVATVNATVALDQQIVEGTAKPSDAITATLGTAAGGLECHNAWRTADRLAESGPRIADDLAKIPSLQSQKLTAINTSVTRIFRIKRVLGLVFKAWG